MNKIFASFLPPKRLTSIENKKTINNTTKITATDTNSKDIYTSSKEKQKNKNFLIGGTLALATLLVGIYIKFRKGKTPPANDVITELINKLKPNDEKLAREFYPILNDNATKLGLKEENFNNVLSAINDQNKNFLKEDGFDVIINNFEKTKDLIVDIAEDLPNIVRKISSENKNLYSELIKNQDKYVISSIDNVFTYLDKINPSKQNFIVSEILPMINKNADSFEGRKNAQRHALLLTNFSDKTKNVIETVAKAELPDDAKYNKYLLLKNTTDDNYKIIEPILNNYTKANLSDKEIIFLMKSIKNDKATQLNAILPYYQYLNTNKIPIDKIFDLLKTPENIEIFPKIMNNANIYNIIDSLDIKMLINTINKNNQDFILNKLTPELAKYKEKFNIKSPDQYVDIMKAITPNTIDVIGKTAAYADVYGDKICYQALLGGITDTNAKNFDIFMKNIKNTDFWGNSLVSCDDFKQALNEIGK